MLILKNIGKDYGSRRALRCVNLVCRDRELIMVLGGNGSGKSTLLYLLGAQIEASRGEWQIDGESTRKYTEKQWSQYRRRVGVADTGALVEEYTLLENAMLPLRLAGCRAGISREQALETLALLGLDKQAGLYPAQLTHAQRKLAGLACALAGDPDVVLVDEPVLGLDAVSAKRVAAVLRESARHCLVIIAGRKPLYPEGDVRTIHLKDGTLESDSDPCTDKYQPAADKKPRRGLPFGGALALALGNLRRRSTGTAVRAFVAFVAVFLAALTYVLSNAGISWSNRLQENVLSVYPITIGEEAVLSGDLTSLARWLTEQVALPSGTEVQINHGGIPWVFSGDSQTGGLPVNPAPSGENLWVALPDSAALRQARYELVSGRWPERYDEVVVLQNHRGEYSAPGLSAMGYEPGANPESDDLLHKTFRLVMPTQGYYPNADGTWGDLRQDADYMRTVLSQTTALKIVGILRPAASAGDIGENEFIGYTRAMSSFMKDTILTSELVSLQQSQPNVDILTGLPFDTQGLYNKTTEERAAAMLEYARSLSPAEQRSLYIGITGTAVGEDIAARMLEETLSQMSPEDGAKLYEQHVLFRYSPASYEENMADFGVTAVEKIVSLRLYCTSISTRAAVSALLDGYTEPLTYPDEAETMIHTAQEFFPGIHRVAMVLCILVFTLGAVAIVLVNASALNRRRDALTRLCCRGAGKKEILSLHLWEAVFLSVIPAALGVVLAWLLSAPVCRVLGFASMAKYCTISPMIGIDFAGIAIVISAATALLTGAVLHRAAMWDA